MAAITANGLEKSYGSVDALADMNVSVSRGELFGFLGPNGAGKTTTIRILTGQVTPDSGDVRVLGVDPTTDPIETRRRVGILPEQESPPSFLTPREYFDFVGKIRSLADETVAERVERWADRLGFRSKLDTLHTDLSRGQQQKVMITQAFLHEPEVVFIDEPLANLDPIVQEQVKRFLVAYAAEDNAIFLSTHNIEVAEDICTRVGIVADGKCIAERDLGGDGGSESRSDSDDASTRDSEDSLLETFLAHVDDANARDVPVMQR
ncbi:ABC transporter ATP-binding protein [Natronoglomus mannanivorans]|uniref:ABC transporter ATP-binding protein n=1 Tax=Natronoglomus mannanivorans TaxID=2979990 RepID=A0AAP3E4R0_9EURY|nr:ABC transporter ATP-binding protein [Halobacteria archaeon AArc-xg1-1]